MIRTRFEKFLLEPAVILEKQLDKPVTVRDIEVEIRRSGQLPWRIARLVGLLGRRRITVANAIYTAPRAVESATDGLGLELATLQLEYNITDTPLTSHRRILGPAITALKNFARKLLTQIFARQVLYNGANARLMADILREIESMRHELSRLGPMATLERQLESLVREHAQLRAEIARLEDRFQDGTAAVEAQPRLRGHKTTE
jgi:cell division protein FtsB